MRKGFAPIVIICIIALLVGALGTVAYFEFSPKPLPLPVANQSPVITIPASNKAATGRFVYFERTTDKVTNSQMAGGIQYKDQFVIYNIGSQTKKVFYQESTTQDNVDQYHLFDNQNVAITSPMGT